jgi:hypothetical protein
MTTNSNISESDVTIQLRHELDEDGEYDAFTSVTCDILVRGTKAGKISGTRVDRERIPERHFLGAMDGHSGDLQYVGVSIFEPRRGRTKLRSLFEAGDDTTEFDFLYIDTFHVDPQYRANGSSDVGAYALRKLLYHPYIKGQAGTWAAEHGLWAVSSVIYILDPYEAMTAEEKSRIEEEDRIESQRQTQYLANRAAPLETEQSIRAKEERDARMDAFARLDANQFLRNGFIQDAAVAKNGGNAPRFLVAAYEHWKQPLKSHAEAAAVQFYVAPPECRPPTGKDAEILAVAKRMCSEGATQGLSSSMIGLGSPVVDNSADRASAFRSEIDPLIRQGGSLARSNALHAACANRDVAIARCILQLDPSCLEARDVSSSTPLMVAAAAAAGSSNVNGIPSQPVIDLLLAAGAQKGAVDPTGLTAYGTLRYMHDQYSQAIQAMTGRPVLGASHAKPGLAELYAKLMPPGGPTAADRTGGKSADAGYVDYGEEDAEYDRDYGDY